MFTFGLEIDVTWTHSHIIFITSAWRALTTLHY